jgi:hypothetical protein
MRFLPQFETLDLIQRFEWEQVEYTILTCDSVKAKMAVGENCVLHLVGALQGLEKVR